MKTFTLIPKNKWVMTAALLAVLGFNVSFNSHQAGIASGDFASTAGDLVESKLTTADGVMPVKYVSNGESEVLAIVPKKMTEGKVCETCGYETISLLTKNKEDIDGLNVQLLKALQKTKPAKAEVAAKEEEAAVEASEETVEKKSPFDAIEKACSRYEKRSEELSCTADKFVAILKRKKGAEIDKKEAFNFYKENIESIIRLEITEARHLANRTRRAHSGLFPYLRRSDDWSTDMQKATQMREKASKVIRTLLAGIPGKYENIRGELVEAETKIAKEEARELQNTFIQARDDENPTIGLYYSQEGKLRRMDLQDLMENMQYQSNAGLSKAASGKDINLELQAHYESYLNNFFQKMNDAVMLNNYTFLDGNKGNITTLPGVNFGPRLSNPGRGNTGSTFSPGISNRVGTNLNATRTQTPVMTMPTQNYGISFGPMVPATPESLRMRMEIRGRQ